MLFIIRGLFFPNMKDDKKKLKLFIDYERTGNDVVF